MFSDSIPKAMRICEFNRYITNATARLKSFPGATSRANTLRGTNITRRIV